MNPLRLLRLLLAFLSFGIAEDDGGGAVDSPAADTPAPVDEPTAPAAAPAAGPQSMLEAIEQGLSGQPRDELGRFAPKTAEELQAQAAAPAQPAAPAAAPAPGAPDAADKPDEITAMPEGLQPKAQERFQRLVNERKELQEQVAQRDEAIGSIRQTFQDNGITQEQFQAATSFIGAVNRGDFQTAEQVLLGQLQQLSVLTGKSYGGAVDGLAGHQDLRQAVDGLQITEQHALELARARQVQAAQQQRAQQQQEAQQGQQQAQQAIQQSTQAVDTFCKQMQASDMDYPQIEAQLLPVLPGMLKNIPPAQWLPIVKAQYQLIKQVAGKARQAPPPTAPGTVLRPTGAGSPAARPSSMFEAMWGQ